MDIRRPEHYYQVALERIKQAEYLYREGNSYALSMYVSGVAVESMLRGFRAKKTKEFESRYDLIALFAESGMLNVGEETLRAAGESEEYILNHAKLLKAAVNDVHNLWHNNLRYISEERLLSHVKRMKLFRKLKGDALKGTALRLYNAASVFVAKGVLQWR